MSDFAAIAPAILQYLHTLNAAAPASYSFTLSGNPRKYHRVVSHGSVHAFIDAQGNVYKPAGYARPAPIPRYNLATPAGLSTLCHHAGQPQSFAGGYLYVNYSPANAAAQVLS